MTVYMLTAGAAAFLISFVFGNRLIPWLEMHNIRQPLKGVIEEKVYGRTERDTDPDS